MQKTRYPGHKLAIASALMVIGCLVLSGCTSWPKMSARTRNSLQKRSRTIVFVVPPSSAAQVASSVAWSPDSANGRASGETVGLFLNGLTFLGFQILHQYQDFEKSMTAYAGILSKMGLPAQAEHHARQAIAQVPWLKAAPYERIPRPKDSGFMHRLALAGNTEATVFIVPEIAVGDDAETLSMNYRIDIYVKYFQDRERAREYDSETVTAEVKMPYPQKYYHFNVLTAPVNSASAWRLQYLFSNHGALFENTLHKAMSKAQEKLVCFLAESCSYKSQKKGFGFD